MNIEELEQKYGILPSHLDRKKVETLLKKRDKNIYPLIDNLCESVSNWLKSELIEYEDFKIPIQMLDGSNNELKAFKINNLIIILVDNYSIFNTKTVSKDIASKTHLNLLSQNFRVIWCKKFEWENLNKRGVMCSLILHCLGKTKIRYYARQTVCDVVPNKELRSFFNDSSFYGYRNADSKAVVLKDKKTNEIVQAMSFGHPYYGQNRYGENSIECIRSAR